MIDAPDEAEAIGMCRGIVERYEVHHGARISDPAVVAAVKLGARYLQGRELPDKAIDLLDEAAAQCRLSLDGGPQELDSLARRMSALEAQHRSLVDEDDESWSRCARRSRRSSSRCAVATTTSSPGGIGSATPLPPCGLQREAARAARRSRQGHSRGRHLGGESAQQRRSSAGRAGAARGREAVG